MKNKIWRAGIIGCGFIGVEAPDELRELKRFENVVKEVL